MIHLISGAIIATLGMWGMTWQLKRRKEMINEKLKTLLETGAITQDEFNELEKNSLEKSKDTYNDEKKNLEEMHLDTEDDLDSKIQRAVDRVANKLGNDNKKLKEALDIERKKNLTSEELKAVEIQEKEQELLKKEQEIKDKEHRMYAIKALKKAGLDDGGEESLALVDFVVGKDETVIDYRVKSLSTLINSRIKKEVERTFCDNGRDPGKGNTGCVKDNPWSRDFWNLTKQMQIELSNPELAQELKASAAN